MNGRTDVKERRISRTGGYQGRIARKDIKEEYQEGISRQDIKEEYQGRIPRKAGRKVGRKKERNGR